MPENASGSLIDWKGLFDEPLPVSEIKKALRPLTSEKVALIIIRISPNSYDFNNGGRFTISGSFKSPHEDLKKGEWLAFELVGGGGGQGRAAGLACYVSGGDYLACGADIQSVGHDTISGYVGTINLMGDMVQAKVKTALATSRDTGKTFASPHNWATSDNNGTVALSHGYIKLNGQMWLIPDDDGKGNPNHYACAFDVTHGEEKLPSWTTIASGLM